MINETISAPTTAGVYVSKNSTTAGINCYNAFAVISMTNATTGYVITAGNYSADSATGKITNLSSFAAWPNVNVTYTYQYGDDACGGIVSAIQATKKIPTWLPIVVILLIVGILLAIVFSVLPSGVGFGKGRGTVAEI